MKIKVGLEIHLRLNTKTKLFSVAENSFTLKSNVNVSHYDFAYPGSLPQINAEAVSLGIKMGMLCNSELDSELHFDRKNYFYFDSPKGFQITQFYRPLAKNGEIKILLPNEEFLTIPLIAIVIEEDTAKTIYRDDLVLVDYNRCGAPLLEVITEPVFDSIDGVLEFIKKIIRLARRLKISNADFSQGFIRVDVNVSTSRDGKNYQPRAELKNLNSLNNIKRAITLEVEYQTKNFDFKSISYTKNYDEQKNELIFLREKFLQSEYCFIRENNIIPIIIPEQIFISAKKEITPWLNYEINFINKYHLNYQEHLWLFANEKLLIYFEKLFSLIEEHKVIFFILKEIFNKEFIHSNGEINLHNFNWALMQELIFNYQKKILNLKQINLIFNQYGKQLKIDSKTIIKDFIIKLKFVASDQEMIDFFKNLLLNDQSLINKYKIKKSATNSYLMGQLMKNFNGKIEPKKAQIIIEKIFESKFN